MSLPFKLRCLAEEAKISGDRAAERLAHEAASEIERLPVETLRKLVKSMNGYMSASQAPHSQYAAGWNAAIQSIEAFIQKEESQ